MLKKRLVAIVVGLALIAVGTMRPAPARAQSVAEDFGIAMAALGVWLVGVTVGAWIVYGPPWSSLSEGAPPDLSCPEGRRGVAFGPQCSSVPGSPQPLACW